MTGRNDEATGLVTPNIARVAFVFGVTGAEQLPGPLLVELLDDLGMPPGASRTLLSRMHKRGMLAIERYGRVGAYRLSGALLERFARIRGDALGAWPGDLHTVVYDVPERDRRIRDRLLAQAERSGYGLLRPGVLVGAWDRSSALATELADAESVGFAVVGELVVGLDSAREVMRRAHRFDDIGEQIRSQIDGLVGAAESDRVPTGAEALRELESHSRDARQLIGYIGAIPEPIVPPEWPVTELHRALKAFDDAFGPAVSEHLRSRIEGSKYRNLVR